MPMTGAPLVGPVHGRRMLKEGTVKHVGQLYEFGLKFMR
jgi:hypothetical protein